MAIYGEMPAGWRIHNVSMGGEPSWVKTFEIDPKAVVLVATKPATMRRRVLLALNPFSGKWFWQTTGTAMDNGKGDGYEYDDPAAAAVVCEMTFGSTKTYEPARRNESWQEGTH
jgi:hypothetical protein